MKSTNNKTDAFSMDDFEKGLMLAGLILPSNTCELKEREVLAAYEASLKQEKRSTYFKRVVLAAEIANQLHREWTFGRVKFQKLVYLCEHAVEMNLQNRYSKLAAGPFDRKFMHTIEKEFESRKWFRVDKVPNGTITRSKYSPLENLENYKPYFQSYFGNQNESITHIINLFRTASTDKSEIAATLYACRIELLNKQQQISMEVVLQLFYEWSEQKQRFPEDTVLSVWHWMVANDLIEDVLQ